MWFELDNFETCFGHLKKWHVKYKNLWFTVILIGMDVYEHITCAPNISCHLTFIYVIVYKTCNGPTL